MSNKIVYIIGTSPLLTTTLIDREILSLSRWGIDLQIFAIRRPNEASPLSDFQYKLQEKVTYLLPVNVIRLIFSHLFFMVRRPKKFFGTLGYLLSRPHPSFFARLKTILHFGEGVYFSYFLRRQDINEIHAHFLDRAAVMALVAKRLLGIPYSLSIHAGADIFVQPVLIREKLLEARKAVTCTRYNKQYLESLIGKSLTEKIEYMPHGLDATKYTLEKGGNGTQLILSVGQLKMRKGFLQLIEVCKTLRDQNYDFRCEIVGGGPLFQTLQQKIADYSLEDTVFLHGALPHEEVMEKYQQATLFVMPCIQTENGDVDGIPNVLLEAMAMQVPVISTKISAIPELIEDQRNGVLVNPNNHDELLEAIVNLLSSPDKRTEFGAVGRQTVLSDFDIDKNITRFAQTLWPELIKNI